MTRTLVIGATSAIAEATCRRFASQGDHLYLVARNAERLTAITADLKIAGAADVQQAQFDAGDLGNHGKMLTDAWSAFGGFDRVLIAHGSLGDQKACEKDFNVALHEITTNAISVISTLTHLANLFEQQGHGTIAVISSVAGDRGRQSNYVYGTAKGAVSIFLQGLRNRLAHHGVHVLTIKLGFVDTPMTASFKKGFLWSDPQSIARGIDKAISQQKDVVYLPFFWYWIMSTISIIPESIFKKMRM